MPPAHLLLAYRLLGWRLGPTYRGWVHLDLSRPGWWRRAGVPVASAMLALALTVGAITGGTSKIVSLVVVILALTAALHSALQDRARGHQGLDEDGDAEAGWYDDDQARLVRNVLGSVFTVALVVAALVLVGLHGT